MERKRTVVLGWLQRLSDTTAMTRLLEKCSLAVCGSLQGEALILDSEQGALYAQAGSFFPL